MSGIKSFYSVIKTPLITEKSSVAQASRQYAFSVDTRANKVEIKKAIEKLYNVKVGKVQTMIIKGTMKRMRANQSGMTPSWKKAIVSLKEGFEIKLT
jgi:large subunit ribosomal protein L23